MYDMKICLCVTNSKYGMFWADRWKARACYRKLAAYLNCYVISRNIRYNLKFDATIRYLQVFLVRSFTYDIY